MDSVLLWVSVVVIIICLCLVAFLYYKYRREQEIIHMYNKTFSHAPDMLTLQRWSHHWDEAVFYNYVSTIEHSRSSCKREKIVFVGLCQDNGKKFLPFWLPILSKLGSYFQDYRIIFLENDSRDDTRELLLAEAKRNPKITILCNDYKIENQPTCKLNMRAVRYGHDKEVNMPSRLEVMRKLREVYLLKVKAMYPDFHYMTVIDWDLMGQLSLEGYLHSLTYLRIGFADGVAVNSFYNYSGTWRVFDTFPMIDRRRCKMLMNKKKDLDHQIDNNYRNKLAYEWVHPVRMESAFGGIATYRIDRLNNASYMSEISCPVECEHSTLSKSIRIFIDPWFTFLLTKNMH